MDKNSNLYSKLLRYSAMTTGIIGLNNEVNSQVIYYDESPDVVITGHQQGYNWDFDGDTNNDVAIITFDGSFTGTYYGYAFTKYYVFAIAAPYSNAAVVQTSGSNAEVLNSCDQINYSDSWNYGSMVMLGGKTNWNFGTSYPNGTSINQSQGNWLGVTDKYLGFRFTENGNVHFGFMRMTVNSDASVVTVKDWAYGLYAQFPLCVGLGLNGDCCFPGIQNNYDELALVRFFNNRLEVKTVNGTAGNLTIVNTEGKIVYNNVINNSYESIDLSNFSAGLYIVNAEFAEGAVQHKVIVR